MNGLFDIRRLDPDDAAALMALRREALESHPLAFGASPEDDRNTTIEAARSSLADSHRSAVLGAFEGHSLIGMVGVVQANGVKRRHKALLWGMYVRPRARNRGIGLQLVKAAVAHAQLWPDVNQLNLSVTDSATMARRLYEAAGFQEWGREPRSIQWEGQFEDEAHLFLRLR